MKEKAEKKPKWLIAVVIVLLLVAAYIIWAVTAAIPSIQPESTFKTTSGMTTSTVLPWPAYGQSAIGLNNLGVVAAHGTENPTPIASVAKLITALCVLQKYPLDPNQVGPTITISPSDVVIYNVYESEGGSDMLVANGEHLSEYQMLEGMLLPSADNIADSLAIWAFGSLANYSAFANQYLKSQGLSDTHVDGDASGYNPSTTSTASDLVKLGQLVMANPTLAGIVAKPSVSGIPVVGTIRNVNFLLGQNNIIGIKTGNTDQAGGVYLSASQISVNNQPLTIITSLMQAPTLFQAIADSHKLIIASQSNFAGSSEVTTIQRGAVVGTYKVPWSKEQITAIASQPVEIVSWGGSAVAETIKLKPISYKSEPNQVVGTITTSSSVLKTTDTTAAILAKSPGRPSKWWTLTHPQSFIHL